MILHKQIYIYNQTYCDYLNQMVGTAVFSYTVLVWCCIQSCLFQHVSYHWEYKTRVHKQIVVSASSSNFLNKIFHHLRWTPMNNTSYVWAIDLCTKSYSGYYNMQSTIWLGIFTYNVVLYCCLSATRIQLAVLAEVSKSTVSYKNQMCLGKMPLCNCPNFHA